MDIVKFAAESKQLELLLNIAPDIIRHADIDVVRLKQILVNLLNNAVKFTASGEIELKVDFEALGEQNGQNRGRYSFAVRDTGIGILPEKQPDLFKAFTQADSSTTRRFGGTGLGLTISSLLAEKMGAIIQLQSNHGQGSTFYFSIETTCDTAAGNSSQLSRNIGKILIVDDNANNRLILEHNCNYWGVGFSSVDSGQTALDLLQDGQRFDIAIIDYHMPDMDGLQTVEHIRYRLRIGANELPIILLHSSLDTQSLQTECQRLDIRFNLAKPVKSSELFYFLHRGSHGIHNQANTGNDSETRLSAAFAKLRATVLIAEDVQMNMLLLRTILNRQLPSATILEAANGLEALHCMQNRQLDLVLMDIQMPVMDGLEATRLQRQAESDTGRHVPIIALTAEALKEEEDRCRAAGMDDFLTKPVDQEKLQCLLGTYLESLLQDCMDSPHATHEVVDEHFDKTAFHSMIADPAIVEQIYISVRSDVPARIGQLETALANNDRGQGQRLAHAIKGSCLNMYFGRLAMLAADIESDCRAGSLDKARQSMESLWKEWALVERLLQLE
jgi:CheY-like chemotaxis protein